MAKRETRRGLSNITNREVEAKPLPNGKHRSTEFRAHPPVLSLDAIKYSRGVDEKLAVATANALHKNANLAKVIVALLDMRQSTTLMMHLENFNGYAKALAEYFTFVRETVRSRGGWFDKFTGDGALFFWVMDDIDPDVLSEALMAVQDCHTNFNRIFFANLRLCAGCIPEEFGLSIGMDYGTCLLSDLTAMDGIRVNEQKIAGTPLVNAVTVLGRPVVGAARMTSAALAGQTVLNQHLGELVRGLAPSTPYEFTLELVSIENKDIKGKQNAYVMKMRDVAKSFSERFAKNVTRSVADDAPAGDKSQTGQS